MDNLSATLGADLGFLTDLGARNGVGLFTEIPKMYAEMQLHLDNGNLFNAGKTFGRIWKLMFDFNLKN